MGRKKGEGAKKKHRPKGDGSIYERFNKEGKSIGWASAISVNGKRVFFYGKTQAEAKEKMDQAKQEKKEGTFAEPNKVKVSDWLDKWLNQRIKTKVKDTTWDTYKYLINTHIKPDIGDLSIRNLTSTHLNDLYDAKQKDGKVNGAGGLSVETIKHIHSVMRKALEGALKERLVSHNVAKNAEPPKEGKKSQRVLTPEEMNKFLKATETHRLYAAFLLDITSGLRVGELLGLRWSDITFIEGDDETGAIINVNRCLVQVRNQEGKRKTKLDFHEPKTEAGKRNVPIPVDVAKELKAYKVKQEQDKRWFSDDTTKKQFEKNNLVFCTQEGKPFDPRNFTRTFQTLVENAGIPHANMHSLRHTFATRHLEAGTQPKVVQELLGHANISMTMDTYSHVSIDLKKNAATKMAGLARK